MSLFRGDIEDRVEHPADWKAVREQHLEAEKQRKRAYLRHLASKCALVLETAKDVVHQGAVGTQKRFAKHNEGEKTTKIANSPNTAGQPQV